MGDEGHVAPVADLLAGLPGVVERVAEVCGADRHAPARGGFEQRGPEGQYRYYGDDFTVECPTGSGRFLTLDAVAAELTRRLTGLFRTNGDGVRPVATSHPKLAADPHSRDHVHFHEYFDGDSGRGVGASHQTGWTGLVAALLHPGVAAAAA